MEIYTLHFDGSCRPKNPGGTAAYGFVLSKQGTRISAEHGVIGSGPAMSNNLAEFMALAHGLEAFLSHHQGRSAVLQVFGDSEIVISIMSRSKHANAGTLYYPAYVQASEALKLIRSQRHMVTFDWIPREQNTECDDLSKADPLCANLA